MKNRKKVARVLAFIMAFIMIFFTLLSYSAFAEENVEVKDIEYVDEQLDFLKKLIRHVEFYYVEDVDYEKVVNEIYEGLFDALDPYSTYFTDSEFDNFVEAVSGEYSGVGVVLTTRDNQSVVVSAMADGPSNKAGIQPEDIIVSINGQDVSGDTTEYIVSLLRGEPGTDVNIGVKREGYAQPILFKITRETIKIDSVFYEMKEDGIAYIRITSFDNNTDEEFKDALEELKKNNPKALILDLRDNGGGYVHVALEVAEEIVPEGPMMHYESKGEITQTIESETSQIDIPIAVLVNGGTASASEIVTGAIQDTNSGTIIGTQTFGKGSAQSSDKLMEGGGIKLTIAHFLTPNKNIIHEKGITPDIIIENKVSQELESVIEQVKTFAPMIESIKPTLNDTGLNVYGAQQRLALLGYDEVKMTGTLDEKTFEAIKHFQSAQGIYPYGVLDLTTRDLLNTEVANYLTKLDKDPQLEKAIEILK